MVLTIPECFVRRGPLWGGEKESDIYILIKVKLKIKVKLSLYLTKHSNIKTYWGVEV
jgi:hypothetical protein